MSEAWGDEMAEMLDPEREAERLGGRSRMTDEDKNQRVTDAMVRRRQDLNAVFEGDVPLRYLAEAAIAELKAIESEEAEDAETRRLYQKRRAEIVENAARETTS
jgi:hypothetical protein